MRRLFLLPLLLLLAACGTDSAETDGFPVGDDGYADAYADEAYPADSYTPEGSTPDTYRSASATPPARVSRGMRPVVLMDRGLGMPIGTQPIPEEWQLHQDLATDPNTGQYARHQLDMRGPHGEFVRSFGVGSYGMMNGQDFQQAWQQLATRGLQGEIDGPSFGSMQRSATLERSNAYRRATAKASELGLRVETLEVPVRGQRQGQPVEGVVYLWRFTSPQYPQMGTFQASVVLSPAAILQETLQLNERLANAYQPNPQHEQRLAQINQQVMQRQSAQHQQRMANRQAAFNAHQRRMAANQASFDATQQAYRGASAAFDQSVQSWRAGQVSGDEMQRRTVNGIHENVDIYNTQTGETAWGVDAGYDSYWTTPGGDVVGAYGYDNPDATVYDQGVNLDDAYDQGGYDW